MNSKEIIIETTSYWEMTEINVREYWLEKWRLKYLVNTECVLKAIESIRNRFKKWLIDN